MRENLGSIPGEGNGNPLQDPGLGEFHGIPRGRQESDAAERLSPAQHHPTPKLSKITREDGQTRLRSPFQSAAPRCIPGFLGASERTLRCNRLRSCVGGEGQATVAGLSPQVLQIPETLHP